MSLGPLVLAYFVIFPEDLAHILGPVSSVLGLSAALSPGLYAVIAVALICWAALRIWGGRQVRSQEPPQTA